MNALNSMLLEGNVVRDAILKKTPKGTSVCTFSVASNRYYTHDNTLVKETSYFDVETWGKLAESCGTNCTKGRRVRIVGRMKQDRWVGSDGKNYSRLKLVGEHVEFKAVASASSSQEEAAMEAAIAAHEDAANFEEEVIPTF